MIRYELYFNIVSKNILKTKEDSEELTSMEQLVNPINELSTSEDSITIYDNLYEVRIMIWGEENASCIMEINNAARGVNYFRKFKKQEFLNQKLEDLNKYAEKPIENSFEFESF